MLAAERQSKIIEMTERKGSVQVEELRCGRQPSGNPGI